jgi:hypothetical protein
MRSRPKLVAKCSGSHAYSLVWRSSAARLLYHTNKTNFMNIRTQLHSQCVRRIKAYQMWKTGKFEYVRKGGFSCSLYCCYRGMLLHRH